MSTSPLKIKIDYGSILPKRKIKNSKKISFCALFSALGVVIMYIGAVLEVLDISMACIASMICIMAVMEIGGAYPWLIYAVTGALSALLLPQKFAALIYIFFAGYYPMLKCGIERLNSRIAEWVIKILVFNVSMGLMVMLSLLVLSPGGMTRPYIIALFAIGNVTFVAYDIALSMLVRLYLFKYRKLFKIEKLLK